MGYKQLHLGIDLRMYRMAGIGRYLQNLLIDLFPRLNAQKIKIFGNSEELSKEDWACDPRIQFVDFKQRIFSAGEQLASFTGQYQGLDLLWCPQYNLPVFYRGKLVVTIHDLCQLAYPETLANQLQRSYAKYLLSVAAKRASAICCVSEFTASEIEKYLQVKKERLVVTYPALGRLGGPPPAEAGKSPNSPYLLAVGNVKKHKNLSRLIAAFHGVRDHIPHNLVVVGKREGFLNSDTDVFTDALDSRVQFTGQVSDRELQEYYRNATALIFPSFYEGFGFPLIEAMAEGCPIACSNVASLPEVAGDAALLFDPFSIEDIGRGLLTITKDARLRATLAQRGKKRIASFMGTKCAELTALTMNRLLEE